MTEEEAKKKWCPATFSQTFRSDCKASDCMAWRWNGYRAEDGKWVQIVASGSFDHERAEGYCGLAGKP